MVLVDFLAIGLVVLFGVIGIAAGFGRLLRFLTKGFKGVILSLFVCYMLFAVVTNLEFVQNLLANFRVYLEEQSTAFCNFLLGIRIDIICTAVVLFIVVQIIRMIIVAIIVRVSESDNAAVRVINRIFGFILNFCVFAGLCLVVFSILAIIFGTGTNAITEFLQGSFFGLDKLFLNNPLRIVLNI